MTQPAKIPAAQTASPPEASETEWPALLDACQRAQWGEAEALLRERAWHTPGQRKWLPKYAWRHLRDAIQDPLRSGRIDRAANGEWWALEWNTAKEREAEPPASFLAAFEEPAWKKNIVFCCLRDRSDISIGHEHETLRIELAAVGGLEKHKGTAFRLAADCVQYWNMKAALEVAEKGAQKHFGSAERRDNLLRWVGNAHASGIVEHRRNKWEWSQRMSEAQRQLAFLSELGWVDPKDFAEGAAASTSQTVDMTGTTHWFGAHGAAVACALIQARGPQIVEDPHWAAAMEAIAQRARQPLGARGGEWTNAAALAQAVSEQKTLRETIAAASSEPNAEGAEGEPDRREQAKKASARL